jgi:hypothetical protein
VHPLLSTGAVAWRQELAILLVIETVPAELLIFLVAACDRGGRCPRLLLDLHRSFHRRWLLVAPRGRPTSIRALLDRLEHYIFESRFSIESSATSLDLSLLACYT